MQPRSSSKRRSDYVYVNPNSGVEIPLHAIIRSWGNLDKALMREYVITQTRFKQRQRDRRLVYANSGNSLPENISQAEINAGLKTDSIISHGAYLIRRSKALRQNPVSEAEAKEKEKVVSDAKRHCSRNKENDVINSVAVQPESNQQSNSELIQPDDKISIKWVPVPRAIKWLPHLLPQLTNASGAAIINSITGQEMLIKVPIRDSLSFMLWPPAAAYEVPPNSDSMPRPPIAASKK